MGRTLICGDLHTKHHIFEKVKEKGETYDKVVFLGDYVDEWDAVPEASYNLLYDLIAYKKDNLNKVILLLGNHDLSEWFGRPFACSGFNPTTHTLVSSLLNKDNNWNLFQIAYAQDGILFTHAGVTKEWWLENLMDCHTAEQVADQFQWVLENRNTDDEAERIFFNLAQAGYARGGYGYPSPVWADARELMESSIQMEQIVGHTPQHRLQIIKSFGRELTFCDTHSLYPDKTPYGSNELLEIVNGEKNIIPLE